MRERSNKRYTAFEIPSPLSLHEEHFMRSEEREREYGGGSLGAKSFFLTGPFLRVTTRRGERSPLKISLKGFVLRGGWFFGIVNGGGSLKRRDREPRKRDRG